MHLFAIVFLVLGAGASSENLLVNPGFDDLDPGGDPKRWELFVMPMEGALGRIEASTASGPYAVMLYNPDMYNEEPANNWSQSIFADIAGKTLQVSGNIRTEDATEAAIWLQCFRKNPTRVLAAATTSTESPTYGTNDWLRVETTLLVPQGTDFVILRCVLKGRGRAWFDDLSVEVVQEDVSGPEADSGTDPQSQDLGRQDSRHVEEMLRSSEEMWEAIDSLRRTNGHLVEEIESLQDRLEALQPAIEAAEAGVIDAALPAPIEPLFAAHPLVPHASVPRGDQ